MKAKVHVALAQIAVEPVPGPFTDALGDPAGQRPTISTLARAPCFPAATPISR